MFFNRPRKPLNIIHVTVITILLVLIQSVCANDSQETDSIYIPIDLEDSFIELNNILSDEDIEEFRTSTEDDLVLYHFSFGQWLRNNWGLWGDSRLALWFNEKEIYHPDDMSAIILDSYWRYLNDQPIHLDEQIKFYREYWAQIEDVQDEK